MQATYHIVEYRSQLEGGFKLKCIYDIVLAVAALLQPKNERQIMSTDAVVTESLVL